MNIGIVTTWFERGAAYVSKAYLEALKEKHNVFIFARGGESYAKGDPAWDLKCVTWGRRFRDSLNRVDWLQFKDWIKKNNIEMVIFNEQQDWEIVVDCKKLGIITVAYIDYYTQNTVKFFDLYDAVICHTKRHYSVFKNHKQAFYIPWGTNVELYKPKELDVCKMPIVFFHSAGMGGIGLRKGTDLVVRAFNELRSKAKLIIHSQVPIDTYKSVSKIIRENPSIEFIEKTVSAPGLYYLGDVYVYPSRLEGLGLTIMEALSSGLPVITTNCGPMNEFVDEGYNGFLVEVEKYLGRPDGYYWAESHCNVNSLTNCMEEIVKNIKNLQQMKLNARKDAVENLNWEKNSINLENCITEIVKTEIDSDYFKKLKNLSLYHSYSSRIAGQRVDKRIIRKIQRLINGLG